MVLYASLANHLYQLAHYVFAFVLLMVIWPRYLFRQQREDAREERLAAGMLRAALLYIVIGYALVILKLFEWLAVVAILLVITFRRYLRRNAGMQRMEVKTAIALLFYGLLDLGFRLRHWFQGWWRGIRTGWRDRLRAKLEWRRLLPGALLLAVVAGSCYLRFYDVWTSAAPGMSDGYVTLAWLKYINQRLLFRDGIYPQGFHITLAYLYKFAAIDQLYILKYTGPLVGLLITLGLYMAAFRFTGNRYAGIVAAALYGLGGTVLHGQDWMRQASTNSQEYAFAFAFPTFWFYARYLWHGRRADLWTASAGCAVAGLVHTMAFAFVGMGLGVVILVGLLLHPKLYWRRIWQLCLSGGAAVVIALIPFGIGELMGKKVHGSTEEFLTSTAVIHPPDLRFWDEVALVALGLTLLYALLSRKRWRDRVPEGTVFGIGAAMFVLYEFGGTVTQSVVLDTRTGGLWSMTMPFVIGAGCHALWSLLRRWATLQALVQTATCVAVIALLVQQTALAPIKPYKMEQEAGVEQYLKIASTYRPKTWMIVSHKEGYALVLGNGYHMYLSDLLSMYDPVLPPLTRRDVTSTAYATDPNIPHDIFIYEEKKRFEVSKDNVIYALEEKYYKQYEQEKAELEWWMNTYESVHGKVEIYYEDDSLRIYHIVQPVGFQEEQNRIWGGS